MRKISIKLLTSDQLVTINSNATYLHEFKQESEVKNLNLNWKNIKLIDKTTKTSLELDNSVLPAGDCYLFCFPMKTKSGASYSDMSFSDLRKLCAARLPKGFISPNPTKVEMIRVLTEQDAQNVNVPISREVEEIPTCNCGHDTQHIIEVISEESLTDEASEIYGNNKSIFIH